MIVEFSPIPPWNRALGQKDLDRFRSAYVAMVGEFCRRYVEPLGAARKTVAVERGKIVLSVDGPGALELVPTFLSVAFGTAEYFEMEAKEKVVHRGTTRWLGDLEPGSSTLWMDRIGPAVSVPAGFRYEPPDYNAGRPGPVDDGVSISVKSTTIGVGGAVGAARLAANPSGLIQIAKQLVYIAQANAPTGELIRYAEGSTPGYDGPPLVIRKSAFPPDTPWVVARLESRKMVPDPRGGPP